MTRPTSVLLPAEACIATTRISAVELLLAISMLRTAIVTTTATNSVDVVIVIAIAGIVRPTSVLLLSTRTRALALITCEAIICAILSLVLLLLDEYAVQFDVAVVHDEVLLHKAL